MYSYMEQQEQQEQQRTERLISGLSLYLLSGGAAFGLEVLVYMDRGWKQGLAWWLVKLPLAGTWLIAPYAGLSALIIKKTHNLRQRVVLLFGSLGVTIFGITIFFDGFFVHRDPRSWILYVLVPIYQWIAVGGSAALRYAIGKR